MALNKIDHVAIIVANLEEAKALWETAWGLTCSAVEEVKDQHVRVAVMPIGNARIELMQPTTPESGVAKFLEKRGEGLHHICIEVEDIDATLAQLKANGAKLIDEQAKIGYGGAKIAFVHPKGATGVLVELVQHTAESRHHG